MNKLTTTIADTGLLQKLSSAPNEEEQLQIIAAFRMDLIVSFSDQYVKMRDELIKTQKEFHEKIVAARENTKELTKILVGDIKIWK